MMRTKTRKRFMRMGALGLAATLWAMTTAAAVSTWEQASQALQSATLPAPQVEALITQAKAREITAAQIGAWAEHMGRIRQAGVPPTLMAERIQQGLIKGVPATRIDQALTTLQANLIWARQLVDRHIAKAEMRDKPAQIENTFRSIEASLRAGMERAQLEQILGKNPVTLDQLATLARMAADLRVWGVGGGDVVRVLAQAANAGISVGELARLEGKFATGVAAGRPAPSLFVELEREVTNVGPHDTGTRDGLGREMRQEMNQEMRQEMQREQMQDLKTRPMDSPSGPSGGGGYHGY